MFRRRRWTGSVLRELEHPQVTTSSGHQRRLGSPISTSGLADGVGQRLQVVHPRTEVGEITVRPHHFPTLGRSQPERVISTQIVRMRLGRSCQRTYHSGGLGVGVGERGHGRTGAPGARATPGSGHPGHANGPPASRPGGAPLPVAESGPSVGLQWAAQPEPPDSGTCGPGPRGPLLRQRPSRALPALTRAGSARSPPNSGTCEPGPSGICSVTARLGHLRTSFTLLPRGNRPSWALHARNTGLRRAGTDRLGH